MKTTDRMPKVELIITKYDKDGEQAKQVVPIRADIISEKVMSDESRIIILHTHAPRREFYKGCLIEKDGVCFECVVADEVNAVFGEVIVHKNEMKEVSYENLFILDNTGVAVSEYNHIAGNDAQ